MTNAGHLLLAAEQKTRQAEMQNAGSDKQHDVPSSSNWMQRVATSLKTYVAKENTQRPTSATVGVQHGVSSDEASMPFSTLGTTTNLASCADCSIENLAMRRSNSDSAVLQLDSSYTFAGEILHRLAEETETVAPRRKSLS